MCYRSVTDTASRRLVPGTFAAVLAALAISWGAAAALAAEPKPVGKSADKRLPLPDPTARRVAEQWAQERYQPELARLARKVLQDGVAINNDTTKRYVLLRAARDMATAAGDLDTGLKAVDSLGRWYAVDALAMKTDVARLYGMVVLRLRPAALRSTQSGWRELAQTALVISERAVAAGKYEAALRLVALADSALPREEKEAKKDKFLWRGQTMAAITKEYQLLAAAGRTLAAAPTDPAANLTLGKFLCLEVGYWREGLPRLVLANDTPLKGLAKEDLAALSRLPKKTDSRREASPEKSPKDPARTEVPEIKAGDLKEARARVKLGDGWWELAVKAKGNPQTLMKERAVFWYVWAGRAGPEASLPKEAVARMKKRIGAQFRITYPVGLTRRVKRSDKKGDLSPLDITNIDVGTQDADLDINYTVERKEDISVPGDVNPNDPIGIQKGKDDPINNIRPPTGLGDGTGGLNDLGDKGYAGFGKPAGSFYGRSGATKKLLLREGGGNAASEKAVADGLDWIARHQFRDGHWSLDEFHQATRCNCANRGNHHNDIAATAFGLLPLLGAGHTHKIKKGEPNPFQKNVLSGLNYLMRKQNKKTGDFGGGMYAHGLASIALCEAYGMTQDPFLKPRAQAAVNYIIKAQDPAGGGWRYTPRQAGDTSVTGWEVMALKSAQIAGLEVPAQTLKKVQRYLDGCMSKSDAGYAYFGKDSTRTMTAVGLLCRQYLQNWGPAKPEMAKAVKKWLERKFPAEARNMYYSYYAAQVLYHLGGDNWKKWNEKMRDALIKAQDTGADPKQKHQKGSWSPVGDPYGAIGGRLMKTSMSILTLEVYYRHLPLFRAKVEKKEEKKKK